MGSCFFFKLFSFTHRQQTIEKRIISGSPKNTTQSSSGAQAESKEADLKEADLKEADLKEADLKEADLKKSFQNLTDS